MDLNTVCLRISQHGEDGQQKLGYRQDGRVLIVEDTYKMELVAERGVWGWLNGRHGLGLLMQMPPAELMLGWYILVVNFTWKEFF